jgi:glycosyltransferase involved in cell wall biosynthesis
MTKNRLHEVKICLDRVGPFVDGVVIVDGCSADDSIFYLRNRNDVHFFLHPWNDNFSEQRNNYIKRAREVAGTDDFWMIISDPDELFSVEALSELPNLIDHCEKNGFNMVQFRCRSVTLKGDVRVWQSLDDYYKGLMFKYKPGIKYVNSPHETLVMPGGLRPVRVELLYEHIKQEDIIIHRGARNQYCGGGGPNLGEKNKLWVELKQIVREVYGKELTWEEYDLQLARGNIDQRIKDWMIKVRKENGWDGSSEHRECYKLYMRIYHPQEEPEELRGEYIP